MTPKKDRPYYLGHGSRLLHFTHLLETPSEEMPLGYRDQFSFQGSDSRVERRYDGFSMYRLPALKSFRLRLQRIDGFNEQSKPVSPNSITVGDIVSPKLW